MLLYIRKNLLPFLLHEKHVHVLKSEKRILLPGGAFHELLKAFLLTYTLIKFQKLQTAFLHFRINPVSGFVIKQLPVSADIIFLPLLLQCLQLLFHEIIQDCRRFLLLCRSFQEIRHDPRHVAISADKAFQRFPDLLRRNIAVHAVILRAGQGKLRQQRINRIWRLLFPVDLQAVSQILFLQKQL